MTSEHEAHVAKLKEFQEMFELVAKEATEHFDYDAAREAILCAVKMHSTVAAARDWFEHKDESGVDVVADTIVDKILS